MKMKKKKNVRNVIQSYSDPPQKTNLNDESEESKELSEKEFDHMMNYIRDLNGQNPNKDNEASDNNIKELNNNCENNREKENINIKSIQKYKPDNRKEDTLHKNNYHINSNLIDNSYTNNTINNDKKYNNYINNNYINNNYINNNYINNNYINNNYINNNYINNNYINNNYINNNYINNYYINNNYIYFNNNINNINYTLIECGIAQIIENAIKLSREQKGSKYIENLIKGGDKYINDKIYDLIKCEIFSLSKDCYGNYVIQTLIKFYLDKVQIEEIFNKLINKVNSLSDNEYGSRVLQTLIEKLEEYDKDKIRLIYINLKDDLNKLFLDKNVNHVIQKIIKKLNLDEIYDIYVLILKNLHKLIEDRYGSYVIQAFLIKNNEKEEGSKIIDKIFEIYKDNFLVLCKGEYTNYILQLTLEKYKNRIKYILEQIKGNIYTLSLDQSASNIIDKLIEYGDNEQRDEIGKEIININRKGDIKIIESLTNNKYGNYVIQKLIKYCSSGIKEEIITGINNIPMKKRKKSWRIVKDII